METQITWNTENALSTAAKQSGMLSFFEGDKARMNKALVSLNSALIKNPGLKNNIDPMSLISTCKDALSLNIPIDGKQAALVPFAGKASLVIMAQGLITLAYRNPNISRIQAFVVREKDEFDYNPATNELTHKIDYNLDESERGDMKLAYALAEIIRGNRTVTIYAICPKSYILKCKNTSRSGNSGNSPWKTWEEQMWEKTAIKKLFKNIPIEDLNAPDEDEDYFQPEQNQVKQINTPPPFVADNPPPVSVNQQTIEEKPAATKETESFDYQDFEEEPF